MSVRGTRPLLVALAVSTAIAAAGCAGRATAPSASASAAPVVVEVYAAASLKRALTAVAEAYPRSHPGVRLAISADSSAALEAKIEQGAPADLLLSADTKNPQRLVDAGLASGELVRFAGNRLVVIVPAMGRGSVEAPADLGDPGVRVVACADGVPLAAYTATWLEVVALLPGYGTDFPARYASNIVSREQNASALVTKVMLGEGDAGVVYASDVSENAAVRVIPIPESENVRATYGGVVVRSGAHAGAAAELLAWLAGPEGQAILARFGFLPPS